MRPAASLHHPRWRLFCMARSQQPACLKSEYAASLPMAGFNLSSLPPPSQQTRPQAGRWARAFQETPCHHWLAQEKGAGHAMSS